MTVPPADAFTRNGDVGALARQMGIAILEATPERVVGTMPVEGNTQPYGLLHGGASAVLAETLGSIGSALHAGPNRIALGLELSATHHRAASEGTVTGRSNACAPRSEHRDLHHRHHRRARPAHLHRAADVPPPRHLARSAGRLGGALGHARHRGPNPAARMHPTASDVLTSSAAIESQPSA